MKTIQVRKGYDIRLQGQPETEMESPDKPELLGTMPAKIPFIKPKLLVREGDFVEIGSQLFIDKRNPDVSFVSPACGKVEQIVFGPRRVIEKIVIRPDAEETFVSFGPSYESFPVEKTRDEVVSDLLKGGLWPFFRVLPYRNIPDAQAVPPNLLVCLDSQEPFFPSPVVYLDGEEKNLAYGIEILKQLCPSVQLLISRDNAFLLKKILVQSPETAVQMYDGAYPAGDPGVSVYYNRIDATQNRSWYIGGQEVLLLARFFQTGRYPIERIVSLGGSAAPAPKHFQIRAGFPLSGLVNGSEDGKIRMVLGGLFRGLSAEADDFFGLDDFAQNLIPEGDQPEFLGFMRPGLKKPSFSRTFLSVFQKPPLKNDSGIHGDVRACFNCGTCVKVCPVDILPQFTYKSVLAGEVEESLSHGLLDCVECGLCTYVCPSKIELSRVLKKAKTDYLAEQG